MSVTLKICTFNVRTECDKSPNSWLERKEYLIPYLKRELPDIIGFQEISNGWRKAIREELSDLYMIEGCGRDKNLDGEAMLVAYRKNLFEAISVRNFWLSLTPDVPGTKFGLDQGSCNRMVTVVKMKHNDSDTFFNFYNTHLDCDGAKARFLSSVLIIQDIQKQGDPFILTGDMNARPEDPEIRILSDFGKSRDLTADLGGTFHSYGRLEKPVKIDYIFSDLESDTAKSYVGVEEPVNGTYISDHWPVFSFVTLP